MKKTKLFMALMALAFIGMSCSRDDLDLSNDLINVNVNIDAHSLLRQRLKNRPVRLRFMAISGRYTDRDKYLTVNNGTNYTSPESLGKGNQHWIFIPTENDGEFFVKNTVTGKYLDIFGGSRANSARVIQWPLHRGNNQRFILKEGTGYQAGYYSVQAKHSGKNVVAFSNGSVGQYSVLNVFDQFLDIEYAQEGDLIMEENTPYRITNFHTGRKVGVSAAKGGRLVARDNPDNTEWIFESTGIQDEYYIKNKATGYYIDLAGNANNLSWARIIQWNFTEKTIGVKQKFILLKNDNGTYYIISRLTRRALVAGTWERNNELTQYTKKNYADQKWYITKTEPDVELITGFSKSKFNEMFPKINPNGGRNRHAIYTYENFVAAIEKLKDVKVKVYRKHSPTLDPNTPGASQKDGKTFSDYLFKTEITAVNGQVVESLSSSDWNASWNVNKEVFLEKEISYGDFIKNSDGTTNKKELAAFFAHVNHESGALAYTAEICSEDDGSCGGVYYTTEYAAVNYPKGNPNAEFFGRGPLQLSWNYNYGPFSAVYYGDQSVLLANPEKVIENGVNAFASAIHFWMLPVDSKPSCHQAINGNRGFATTINVINGGLECGATNAANPEQAAKVAKRIEYYKKFYKELLGTDPSESDTELNCADLDDYSKKTETTSTDDPNINPGTCGYDTWNQAQANRGYHAGDKVYLYGDIWEAAWDVVAADDPAGTTYTSTSGWKQKSRCLDGSEYTSSYSIGICGRPTWHSGKAKVGYAKDDVVAYNGKLWISKWQPAGNDQPGSGGAWKETNCAAHGRN